MTARLEASYQYCERLAQRSGSNFVVAFRTLPREMYRQMCVLYAFMRHTDDLGDQEELPLDHRRQLLARWSSDLQATFERNQESGPVLTAIVDVARRQEIPLEDLNEVIRGVEGDLTPRVFQSFPELEHYCYQVAGVVGLCCLKIWGYRHQEPRQSAIACGTAFQLTNILRDLKEDSQRSRIYLPASELAAAQYSRQELEMGVNNAAFQHLMQFQVQRTWSYYQQAYELQEHLLPPGRRIFRAFFDLYSSLLDEIERAHYDVLTRRIQLTRLKKASVALRCLLRIDCRNRTIERRINGSKLELPNRQAEHNVP